MISKDQMIYTCEEIVEFVKKLQEIKLSSIEELLKFSGVMVHPDCVAFLYKGKLHNELGPAMLSNVGKQPVYFLENNLIVEGSPEHKEILNREKEYGFWESGWVDKYRHYKPYDKKDL